MNKRTRSKLRHPDTGEDALDDGDDKNNVPDRVPISFGGVFVGVTLIVIGVWVFLSPSDMLVEHHRLRYLPTVAEHITPLTSRIYGVVGVVLGLLVLALATYSPRR